MTREEIHNEIGNILKLIEINNNRMFLNDTDFAIDLELQRSYIVRLYGLHDQLTISQPTKLEAVKEEVKTPEPVVIKATPKPRPKKAEPVQEEVIDKPVVEKEVVEEVESIVEPEEIVEVHPEPVVETPVEQASQEKAPEPPVVKKQTKIATKPAIENDVYARLKNTKLDSIKKGISISKRYEIQNELFNNNPETYNSAIKTLDNQSDFDEAMSYLEGTLMAEHQWAEDDFLVDELRILLYRRYA
ncbi:MAG: hypothetical protein ACI8SE_000804 [Bacteroidia bacterium]|jgi:hypothetical protein